MIQRAAEVLPPNLRSGPHFKVQDRVAADGYMLRFTVTSDYGTFPVTGEYGLRKLIKEIQAIALKKTQNMAEILAAYQHTVSPIQEITAPGAILARAANGTVLIPFPLDYGVWTVRADRVVKNTLAGYKASNRNPARFEFWVTGAVSPLARRQLEAQGITVVEHLDRRIGMMD